ncbi:GntR family transcriptional regulator [Pseudonocardia sp. DLS-67]
MAESSSAGFPYHRIVADLRDAIVSGELPPGDQLGSEWTLAERFGASRPTVRRAIAVLKAEGLVVTEQGRGTFVRPRPSVRLTVTGTNFRRHRSAGLAGFNAQAREQGLHPEQRLLGVTEATGPAEIVALLGAAPETPLVLRRRLFLIEGEPVARVDSYFPATLVRGTRIAEESLVPGGTARIVEDPDGPIRRRLARSVDELVSRMPTPEEVELLRIPPGVPVVQVHRTMYDVSGDAVEVQVSVATADRHTFRYEVDL